MLVTLLLWQLGSISTPHFYISRFFEEHKADYIHHMREVSSTGAWENWCIFFLGAVKEQAFQNLQVAESTRNLLIGICFVGTGSGGRRRSRRILILMR